MRLWLNGVLLTNQFTITKILQPWVGVSKWHHLEISNVRLQLNSLFPSLNPPCLVSMANPIQCQRESELISQWTDLTAPKVPDLTEWVFKKVLLSRDEPPQEGAKGRWKESWNKWGKWLNINEPEHWLAICKLPFMSSLLCYCCSLLVLLSGFCGTQIQSVSDVATELLPGLCGSGRVAVIAIDWLIWLCGCYCWQLLQYFS